MIGKILYLPLDERPCNYDYPQYIAKIGACNLLCPPISLMGKFKKPADVDGLWQWVFDNASDASHIILSTDLMLYGGIVPSRLHTLTREQCDERIAFIEKLHMEYPRLKIYAFGLITRAPAYSSADEEPDYYEYFGKQINRYGVLIDKEMLKILSTEEYEELCALEKSIPADSLDDFLARRKTNFESLLKLISYAASGIIDTLVVPLDDCKPHGFASGERRGLATFAAAANVLSKVLMYPGADEAGCVLVARCVCSLHGNSPSVYIDYSSNQGKLTIPPYEDRSIGETAPYHILACGARQGLSAESSDVGLFINAPTEFSKRLEDELDRSEIHIETERNLPAFLQRIQILMQSGRPCFVADCAVPNGADTSLMLCLKETELIGQISGYSGWNTSSNALGTAAAHAVVYASAKLANVLSREQREASDKFRLMRYIEDWGYMTNVRRELTSKLSEFGDGLTYFTLQSKNEEVSKKATEMLDRFAKRNLSSFGCSIAVSFPWNRMFEIELDITL